MTNLKFLLAGLILLTLSFTACDKDEEPVYEEVIAVANRGSESVSFINTVNDEVLATLTIAGSEPMYVVYVANTDKIYVGDRAQNQVHVIDPTTRTVDRSIDVGNGVFHMWAGGKGEELWVNNDIDNSVSVIDLAANTVRTTIQLDVKPHDVFVSKNSTLAYVSVLSGDANTPDSIFAYSTSTAARIATQAVGKDPHLYHLKSNDQLLVPCQSGLLYCLSGNILEVLHTTEIEGVHGITATDHGPSTPDPLVFVANISGNQLFQVNAEDCSTIGNPVTTSSTTPHNLVVNENRNKIFVTHSGQTANTVSTYSIIGETMIPSETITVGTNPFGLAYYKRQTN